MKNANGILIISTVPVFLAWIANQPEIDVEFVL